jgi:hypothetical protein
LGRNAVRTLLVTQLQPQRCMDFVSPGGGTFSSDPGMAGGSAVEASCV